MQITKTQTQTSFTGTVAEKQVKGTYDVTTDNKLVAVVVNISEENGSYIGRAEHTVTSDKVREAIDVPSTMLEAVRTYFQALIVEIIETLTSNNS